MQNFYCIRKLHLVPTILVIYNTVVVQVIFIDLINADSIYILKLKLVYFPHVFHLHTELKKNSTKQQQQQTNKQIN